MLSRFSMVKIGDPSPKIPHSITFRIIDLSFLYFNLRQIIKNLEICLTLLLDKIKNLGQMLVAIQIVSLHSTFDPKLLEKTQSQKVEVKLANIEFSATHFESIYRYNTTTKYKHTSHKFKCFNPIHIYRTNSSVLILFLSAHRWPIIN